MSGTNHLRYASLILAFSLIMLVLTSRLVVSQGDPYQITVSSPTSPILTSICEFFNTIRGTVFLIVLVLMVLGAVIYASANFLGSNLKKQFEGYGMAIMLGCVIGLIIVLLAPYIITLIIHISGNIGSAYGENGGASALMNKC
jgi:heme/copper-type cytochrome/quinol oxidase subunit 2